MFILIKMKTKIKNILICLIGLFVVIVLALVIFINQNYNIKKISNEINTQIENEIAKISDHYLLRNKEVKFKMKSVSMKVFPQVKIVIYNLELKNIEHQNVVFNGLINNIEIKLKLADIFNKNVNLNNIVINGANINFEKIVLDEFYLKQEKVKKMVRLEGNEVLGIREKLKEILTGKLETQEANEGGGSYREVEVEETVRVDLDNTELKNMFINIIKNLSTEKIKYNNDKISTLEFIGIDLNMIDNNNVVKEYKNIAGKMSKNNNAINYKFNFIMSNINSSFSGKINFDQDKAIIESNISNEVGDKTEIYLNVNNNLLYIDDIKYIVGEKKLAFKTPSLNNFIQWLLPTNSYYYTKFNYKKSAEFTANMSDVESNIILDNLTFKSDDLIFEGDITLGLRNKIRLNVTKADLNNFIIQGDSQVQEIKHSDINIFKTNNLDELLKIINKENENVTDKIFLLDIKIDNFISGINTIRESEISLEINNGFYRFEKFQLNFNDLNINIFGEEKIDNFHVSNLTVKSNNIKNILKYFDLDSFAEFEDFELNSKLFIHDNIIYLKDFVINDEAQHLKGDIEFSIDTKKKYFASNLHIDKVNIEMKSDEYKTVKEKFIWMNTIRNNVFLNLIVDNLIFNGIENIYFDGNINYKTNLLNLYNIRNISFENAKNVSGKFEIGIKASKPFINISLDAKNVLLELNLLDFFVNVNKYKNLVLDDKIEESPNYWINRLFSLPNWIDVDGKIKLTADESKINSKDIKNFIFDSTISNGYFDLKNVSFIGIGGKTELKGKVDLKEMKKVDLNLGDTTYSVGEVLRLLVNSNTDIVDGIIGVSFVFKAQGYNKSVFLSSMSLESKFIGKNLYVKKLGLAELEDKLRTSIFNNDVLYSLVPREIILNNSGTLFNDFSGNLLIAKNILNLNVDAVGSGYSNKLIAKVDSSKNKSIFNFNNVSSIVLRVGNNIIPLYVAMNFLENLEEKANMIVDTGRVDEYLNLIRKEMVENGLASPKNN
jgi:hypothetical protein